MSNFVNKKRYGQNFLIDRNILDKIITSIKASDTDLILEIGAGSGNLTKELKNTGARVLSYEIDQDLSSFLNPLIDNKTDIIFADFLSRDIAKDLQPIPYNNLYIVANLPYYITTPIIEKVITSKLNPTKMILMVQNEVANRLSATPHSRDYGFMTVYLNYYFTIRKLFEVRKTAFRPIPKVDSAVLEFTSHNMYQCDEQKFINLIKTAFKHKRKNLNNNLNNYDKELITSVLTKHNLSLASRAEDVSIEVFIEIVNAL